MSSKITTAALALAALAAQPGCGFGPERACFEADFEDEVTIGLPEPLRARGSYEVSVDADGELTECELLLVDSSDPSDCIGDTCESELRSRSEPDAPCALGAVANDELRRLRYRQDGDTAAPPTLGVEITSGGQTVAQRLFFPEYEVDEPNGVGCGERERATVTLELTPPAPAP